MKPPKTALELFNEAIAWLRGQYGAQRYYVERDIVWTVQERLRREIDRQGLSFRVFNDYGIIPGKHRSLSTDLALLGPDGDVELAVEFKFEPSHRRTDIPKKKFPVVFWGAEGVGKDVGRVRRFVAEGRAEHAIAMFIDEGGYFARREPQEGSEWLAWDEHPEFGQTMILWTEIDSTDKGAWSRPARGAVDPHSDLDLEPQPVEMDAVVEVLDTRLSGWRDRIRKYGQVNAADERAAGRLWTDDEVFEGFLFSILSSNTNWDRVARLRNELPALFRGFSIDRFANHTDDRIDAINDWFQGHRAGSMTLRARLLNLRTTAGTLIERSAEHGSIEQYFRVIVGDDHPRMLARALAKSGGQHKLAGFGIPLAAEALRNIGYDLAKPDRHVNRFVGARGWMSFRNWKHKSPHSPPTASAKELLQSMDCMEAFAHACGERVSFVDSAVWLLCAQGGAHLQNRELASLEPRRIWDH